jgi:hypothetical protein
MTEVQKFDRAVAAAREELDGKMLADMTAFIEITVKWRRDPTAFSKGAYAPYAGAANVDRRDRIPPQPRQHRPNK